MLPMLPVPLTVGFHQPQNLHIPPLSAATKAGQLLNDQNVLQETQPTLPLK